MSPFPPHLPLTYFVSKIMRNLPLGRLGIMAAENERKCDYYDNTIVHRIIVRREENSL